MVELADTQDLGSCGRPCRFESCYPHHKLNRPFMGLFNLSYDRIRTRTWEGATVVRQPGELSNRERVEPTERGGEAVPARAEGEAAGVLLSAP